MRSDKAIAIVIAIVIAEMISLRLRLEAYTLSNRGRSLRIADSQSAGWKPVPKHNLYSLLIAQVGYWLPASGEEHDHNP